MVGERTTLRALGAALREAGMGDLTTAVNIALRVRAQEDTEEMLEWLKAGDKTENEICEKASEIHKRRLQSTHNKRE